MQTGRRTSEFPASALQRQAVWIALGFLTLFAQLGRADDPLHYFKNYFVTGDYAVAGVGLRGHGVGGFATGAINMSGVPAGADLVAVYLYWGTVETTPAPSSAHGFFDGKAIVGKVLGNPNNPACGSSGGTTGPAGSFGRVYRTDVLRYLAIDHTNNIRIANGQHMVRLPDSGGNGIGNGPYTNGASMVAIYRIVKPGNPLIAPLRAVVIYDGTFTMNRHTEGLEQTIGGFYQASEGAAAKMTHIVANGQPDFEETLKIEDETVASNPFRGRQGSRWDNPTFNFELEEGAASVETRVSADDEQICLTWGAIVISTKVTDTDHDGLLNVWETRGLHLNIGDATHKATFGGCADYRNEPCVNLPAMGANPNKKDIFVEIDWMSDGVHEHKPKLDALSAIAATFSGNGHNIAMHFDVGPNYQGNPFIVPAAYAHGGEVIPESLLTCTKPPATACVFSEPYSVVGWKRGFRDIKDGSAKLHIPAHFLHIEKDTTHYVVFGHALAGPFDAAGKPLTVDPKSVSGVADRPGGDVMITLGLWKSDKPANAFVGSAAIQAGTLMHELGHNLDLSHAGLYRTPNCMPNYQSVMNYLYQRGLTAADNSVHIDFSNGALAPLNENSLSETTGLGALNYRVKYYGLKQPSDPPGSAATVHCTDGTPVTGGPDMIRLENMFPNFIDWNHDGVPTPGLLQLDVNLNGSLGDGVNVAAGKYFVDSPDWSSLNLQQIGARRNVNGLSSDVGDADLGDADLGDADLGDADLGDADLGDADLGDADLGDADLGDLDYDTAASSTVDPPPPASPDCPTCGLKATNKIDRITLSWTSPGDFHVDSYNIYRSDPAHTTPTLLKSVPGGLDTITTDDVVNSTSTLYNTPYTYYVTSVTVIGSKINESLRSTTASGIVKHLFVTALNPSRLYGDPNPAVLFTVTGLDLPAPAGSTCTTTAVNTSDVGPYTITCSGPATTANPIDGITYTNGTLTVNQRPVTASVTASDKFYDGNNTASSACTLPGLLFGDPVTCSGAGTFPSANVGGTYTVTVTGIALGGPKAGDYVLASTTAATTPTVKINPKTASVTPAASGKIFGAPDPVLSGSLVGFLAQDIVTATYTRVAGAPVAVYLISATLSATGSPGSLTNYSITSNTANFTITPAPQIISFGPLTNMTFGNPDFAVIATAPGGPVTFSALDNCTVTSNGATVHLTSAGSCTITAHQAGGGNYLAAPDLPQMFTIASGAGPTIVNGSFEQVQIVTPPFNSLTPADIPGWTHTGDVGDALLWHVGYTDGGGFVTTAGDGTQFVTLGGGYGASGGSAHWQTTITGLTPNARYVLTFKTATESGFVGGFGVPQTMTVGFVSGSDANSQSFLSPASTANYWRVWATQHYTFIANSTSAVVEFSVSEQPYDMGLDNVTVAAQN